MKAKRVGIVVGLAASAAGLVWWRSVANRNKVAEQGAYSPPPLALDRLACPRCHGHLTLVGTRETGMLSCASCKASYPVVDGIPHFVAPEKLTGLNRRLSGFYDLFSWVYRLFSRLAFAYIGIPEEQARREVLDRLEPQGGAVLEVSIGPGVNMPYLIGRPDVREVHGLDISLGQLRRCQSYAQQRGWSVPLYLGNAEELPFNDDVFDAVFHIGGINFFNDKAKALAEMVRVAKPGTRIMIADETERGAQAYERLLPGFGHSSQGGRPEVVPPVDALPPGMQEVRAYEIWKGWGYCLEFRKPAE